MSNTSEAEALAAGVDAALAAGLGPADIEELARRSSGPDEFARLYAESYGGQRETFQGRATARFPWTVSRTGHAVLMMLGVAGLVVDHARAAADMVGMGRFLWTFRGFARS